MKDQEFNELKLRASICPGGLAGSLSASSVCVTSFSLLSRLPSTLKFLSASTSCSAAKVCGVAVCLPQLCAFPEDIPRGAIFSGSYAQSASVDCP